MGCGRPHADSSCLLLPVLLLLAMVRLAADACCYMLSSELLLLLLLRAPERLAIHIDQALMLMHKLHVVDDDLRGGLQLA